MTEVQRDSRNNSGLFSKRAYKAGDIILEEDVIFTFGPTSPEQDALLQSQLDGMLLDSNNNSSMDVKANQRTKKTSTSLSNIEVPSTVEAKYAGKFRGMLVAAMCFVLFANEDNETKDKVLSLYAPSISSPSSDLDKSIISVAMEAKEFCKKHASAGSQLRAFFSGAKSQKSEEELIQAMLVWTCNAFDGGLLYEKTSRINHSCDPNAMVAPQEKSTNKNTDNDKQQQIQKILATADIQTGEEIFISYLGTFTYAGGAARLARLEYTKHFTCTCTRCQSCDWASAIPCASCHPRTLNSKYLEEDIQYDDDHNVHYAYPKNAQNSNTSVRCKHCNEATTGSTINIGNKVANKVATHMVSQQLLLNKLHQTKNKNDNNAQSEIDEQLFQLSSSVLGSKHWCTNFMMLTLLNQTLHAINSAMILSGEAPDLTEVAECIDSLERLWDFTSGLNLRTSASHLLAGPTVGVARVLISLGDEKSQNYGAEWVSRIEDYVQQGFEGQGMIKVVDAIKGARNKNTCFKNNQDQKQDETMEENDDYLEDKPNKKKRATNH